jgi:hypothetical protein
MRWVEWGQLSVSALVSSCVPQCHACEDQMWGVDGLGQWVEHWMAVDTLIPLWREAAFLCTFLTSLPPHPAFHPTSYNQH